MWYHMTLHVISYARGGNTWLTILSYLMIRTWTLDLHWINPYKIQKNKGKYMCPWHWSGHTKGFLNLEEIDLLPWTTNSPDMNCIENCWDHVDHMLHSRNLLPNNLDELWEALKEEWYHIDQEYIDKLYNSMSHWVRDLLKAEGRSTHYLASGEFGFHSFAPFCGVTRLMIVLRNAK